MRYQVTICIIRVRVSMHYKGVSFMHYQWDNMHYFLSSSLNAVVVFNLEVTHAARFAL